MHPHLRVGNADAEGRGDLLVGESAVLFQYDHIPQVSRQSLDRVVDETDRFVPKKCGFATDLVVPGFMIRTLIRDALAIPAFRDVIGEVLSDPEEPVFRLWNVGKSGAVLIESNEGVVTHLLGAFLVSQYS